MGRPVSQGSTGVARVGKVNMGRGGWCGVDHGGHRRSKRRKGSAAEISWRVCGGISMNLLGERQVVSCR